MTNKKSIYEEILLDSLGKGYIVNVDIIKEEQCLYCTHKNKNECRLNIKGSKCNNFKERGKRNESKG